jgi:hypothetical protein
MSYILYISKKKPPTERELDRLIDIHRTDQDDVIVREDDTLDSGFKIIKVDTAEISKTGLPELKEYLGIKEYKFKERITAKENERKNKLKAGLIK